MLLVGTLLPQKRFKVRRQKVKIVIRTDEIMTQMRRGCYSEFWVNSQMPAWRFAFLHILTEPIAWIDANFDRFIFELPLTN